MSFDVGSFVEHTHSLLRTLIVESYPDKETSIGFIVEQDRFFLVKNDVFVQKEKADLAVVLNVMKKWKIHCEEIKSRKAADSEETEEN